MFSNPLLNIAMIILAAVLLLVHLFSNASKHAKMEIPSDKNKQVFKIKEHKMRLDGSNEVKTQWTLHYFVQYKNKSDMREYRENTQDSLGYTGSAIRYFSSKNEAELKAQELSQYGVSLSGDQEETLVVI